MANKNTYSANISILSISALPVNSIKSVAEMHIAIACFTELR